MVKHDPIYYSEDELHTGDFFICISRTCKSRDMEVTAGVKQFLGDKIHREEITISTRVETTDPSPAYRKDYLPVAGSCILRLYKENTECIVLDVPFMGTIVPFMGTQLTDNAGEALFGKVRRNLLSLFLLNTEESYSFRETARLINAGHGAVHRELANLVGAGIIICEKVGNQTRYQADSSCNVFKELQGLQIKTTGIGESIKQSIQGLKKSISIAFIFGSYANNSVRAGSDVDLIVIGHISFQEIVSSIFSLQRKFGREINPTVYSPESFSKKADSGFIQGVIAGRKIFLIGDEDELEKLV